MKNQVKRLALGIALLLVPHAAFAETTLKLIETPAGNAAWSVNSAGVLNGERLNCLVRHGSELWLGSSFGSIQRWDGNDWATQTRLEGMQVTDLAFEPAIDEGRRKQLPRMWVATSDGIRCFESDGETVGESRDTAYRYSEPKLYRQHYQGHPAFVSGGYIPGRDAVRQWGHVDHIYVPKQIRDYAPFVVSNAHGLFTWASFHGVWHHFLPHYGGANTAWLDTRELLPMRRPTCIAEDRAGNLWIGSEGDGLVLMKANARKQAVGDDVDAMWQRITPSMVGCKFHRVNAIHAAENANWFALQGIGKRRWIARQQDGKWENWELLRIETSRQRGGKVVETKWWQATPVSLVTLDSGKLWIGVEGANSVGLLELDPESGSFVSRDEVQDTVRSFARLAGELWLMTDRQVMRLSSAVERVGQ